MNRSSIKRNIVLNTLLTVSSLIFPLITFKYASQILHPEGIGRIGFGTSVVYYFNIFAQLGIPTYGIRACARAREDRTELTQTVHEILTINLIFTALTYLLFFGSLFVVPRFSADRPLLVMLSATILLNSIGMEWLYKGLEKYDYITARSLAFKVIGVVLLLLTVKSENDYLLYGFVTIFAASASNVLNLLHAKRYIGLRPIRKRNLAVHMKPILVFFGMAIATTVYTNLDVVMLGLMKSNAEVGFYNSAIKIKTILVGVVTAMGAVLLPRASLFISEGDYDSFYRVSGKALHWVCAIAIPFAIFFSMFAKTGVLLLSDETFLGSVPAMRIIMPTVLLIGLTNIMGIQMLVPLGRERTVLRSEIVGAVVDFVLNLLLIPRFGAAGAAAGTLCAELGVLAVQAYALRQELKPLMRRIRYWDILLANAAAIGASFWVCGLNLRPLFLFLIGGALYFGVALVVLLLLKNEIALDVLDSVKKVCARLRRKDKTE